MVSSLSFVKRELWGGAVTAELPSDLLDVSDLRQVPDHQEVWLERDGLQSVSFDLLGRVEDDTNHDEVGEDHGENNADVYKTQTAQSRDRRALISHVEDISPGAEVRDVEIVTSLIEIGAQCTCYTALAIPRTPTQSASNSQEDSAAPDPRGAERDAQRDADTALYLALIRYTPTGREDRWTDILITVTAPKNGHAVETVMKPGMNGTKGSQTIALNGQSRGLANGYDDSRALTTRAHILQSFRIVDHGLFG